MIELLLQAERELTVGMVDSAERLFGQVLDADPRNGIALVGLARVALERGDERKAYELAGRALALDPQNAAAQRLVARFTEVFAVRGETVPPAPAPTSAQPPREQGSSDVGRPRPGLLGRLLGRR
jgi:thioredoxin-like negative regulator of GroEL